VHEYLLGQGQPPGFGDPVGQLLAQYLLVYGDEEVCQVELQVEDRIRPVLTGTADLRLKAL